ncbi:Snf7-domain-containing protein [Podospora didyma]|uniref:Snf7-domain-containing protein n=1 Tax=Podospora didyma TaxID=330526 RepID=A0AAE0K0E2_9PEZI|nr:Snf7-domain-containing protein [Podospora didyma]
MSIARNLRAVNVKRIPPAPLRRCNGPVRSNARELDRRIANTKQLEIKAKNLILQADKRAARDPRRQAQARWEMRDVARELIQLRKTSALLVTSKAQLASVQMRVNEAFAARRIEGTIRASVGAMHDVNSLIRLPELAGTMQELSVELIKAGIIEEIVGENLPQDDFAEFEEEAAKGEVDKVLGEILKDRMTTAGEAPAAPIAQKPIAATSQQEEEEEDGEAMVDRMRYRLEALRS